MIKQIIYTNLDNQDFIVVPEISTTCVNPRSIKLEISNGCSYMYFLNKEEIDEFCQILQDLKKEVWDE